MEVRDTKLADPARYDKWTKRIDAQIVARIVQKVRLLKAHGLDWGEGHVRRIEGNLYELKVSKYRLYFRYEGTTARFVDFGEKDTQGRDIQRAKGRT